MARKIMWFLLPQDLQALVSDTGEGRSHIPIYINPQTFDIKESKLINHSLAKGGYIVQYWGEELPIMSASGTTGSGGIEAINILRDIYRHEQLIMKRVLIKRAKDFAENATNSLEEAPNAISLSANPLSNLASAADSLFDDAVTNISNGISSAVEGFTAAYEGVSNFDGKVGLVPSLGAFAVSIDIFFQGCKYRGFFKDFSVQETADSPGIFTYSFTFMITRKTGERKNFMPWHRKPTNIDGSPKTASIPSAGAATNELSFGTDAEYGFSQGRIIGDRKSSTFNQTQEGTVDENSVPVNRRSVF